MVEDPRQELERLCREQGEDFATLSRLIGRNATYIQQFVRRGTPRRLAAEDRRKIALYLGVDERRLGAKGEEAASGFTAIARHPGNGAAGGTDAGQGLRIALPTEVLACLSSGAPEQLFLHRVEGDSMAPTMHAGDELIVDGGDLAARLRDGLYLVRQGSACQVRRLSLDPTGTKVRVQTDNPAYADWDDCAAGAIDCLGRVVWAGRRIA